MRESDEQIRPTLPVTRVVNGKIERMDRLPADMLTRIELLKQLNDRLKIAEVSDDWSDVLKLEQMFLSLAAMVRKEIDKHAVIPTHTSNYPTGKRTKKARGSKAAAGVVQRGAGGADRAGGDTVEGGSGGTQMHAGVHHRVQRTRVSARDAKS